jgi:phosphoribosylamine-glycine ligase
MAEFINAVARGEQCNVTYRKQYGIVNSIATGPFPYPPEETDKNWAEINYPFNIDTKKLAPIDFESIHLEEISKLTNESGEEELVWTGQYGYAGYVTASADTIPEAKQKVERLRSAIKITDMKYRTDVGDRVHEHDIPTLKKQGWI